MMQVGLLELMESGTHYRLVGHLDVPAVPRRGETIALGLDVSVGEINPALLACYEVVQVAYAVPEPGQQAPRRGPNDLGVACAVWCYVERRAGIVGELT